MGFSSVRVANPPTEVIDAVHILNRMPEAAQRTKSLIFKIFIETNGLGGALAIAEGVYSNRKPSYSDTSASNLENTVFLISITK